MNDKKNVRFLIEVRLNDIENFYRQKWHGHLMINSDCTLLAQGSYSKCIQAISKDGIENGTSWMTRKKTNSRTVYACSQTNCRCKAEIHTIEKNGEIISEAILIGKHVNHETDKPKPLHEHLIHIVTRATESGTKSLKQSVATEIGMQVPYRNLARIKRVNLSDGAWEPLWQKLPNFVERINKDKNLAFT